MSRKRPPHRSAGAAKPTLGKARDRRSSALPKAGSAGGTHPIERRGGRFQGHPVTYQLEHVLCNKSGCRRLHGPYWYAYWWADGRTQKKYIGAQFRTVSQKLRNKRAAEPEEE